MPYPPEAMPREETRVSRLNCGFEKRRKRRSTRADWASAPGNAAPLGLIGWKNRENREKRYDLNSLDFAMGIGENGPASNGEFESEGFGSTGGARRSPTPLKNVNSANIQTPPIPISSVNHLAVITRDLDASLHFYRDVLGFREVERPNFNFAGAWLANYGLMIHIIVNNPEFSPEGEIQTRDAHIALHSENLAEVERLLTEHGVPFRRNEVPGRNIKQLFFKDPDGFHIEVGTYPPLPPFLN